jgi:hypothetical protein
MPPVNPMSLEDYERHLQQLGMGQDSAIPAMVQWRKDNLETNQANREAMRQAAMSTVMKAAGAL